MITATGYSDEENRRRLGRLDEGAGHRIHRAHSNGPPAGPEGAFSRHTSAPGGTGCFTSLGTAGGPGCKKGGSETAAARVRVEPSSPDL